MQQSRTLFFSLSVSFPQIKSFWILAILTGSDRKDPEVASEYLLDSGETVVNAGLVCCCCEQ